MKLLSNAASNPKTAKKLDEYKFEGVIQHLTPDKLADGRHTICPWSTEDAGKRASTQAGAVKYQET